MTVELVDFSVVPRLPAGIRVVSVEWVLVLSVTTPLLSVVCRELLEFDPPITGTGIAGVDCVEVVLEDDVCAKAMPVIITSAVVTARQCLNMLCTPENNPQAGIARCSNETDVVRIGLLVAPETTQSHPTRSAVCLGWRSGGSIQSDPCGAKAAAERANAVNLGIVVSRDQANTWFNRPPLQRESNSIR